MGVAQGPEHAMNPRELVACAEAAMMTAKARGKNQSVVYDDGATERPSAAAVAGRDVRSIAHLKMLQSLAGKLNRLNDVAQIGSTIATELRQLIDYHNCRVVLRHGDELRPIAFVGDTDDASATPRDAYTQRVGVGVTGRAVETGEALLIPNALECDFALPDSRHRRARGVARGRPLRYGSRVTGAIVISKLGVNQFDEDDVRLLEVLAGQASVALENARLYEQQRREADGAKALLAFADELSRAHSVDEIQTLGVQAATRIFETVSRLDLVRRRVRRERRGTDRRRRVGAAPGGATGPTGRVVVDVENLDEDRERLLAAFGYQLSVALQKARLYGRHREAAEIANALLDASRELATAETPEEVLRRSVEVTARVLATERASLWIQEEAEPRDLVGRASVGYPADIDPAAGRRYPAALAHEWLERAEPFVLEPEDVATFDGVAGREHRPLRRRAAPARRRPGRRAVATVGDRFSSTGSSGSSRASRIRRSSRSRAPSTSTGSSARSSRRSRRSRTRSRRTTSTRRPTPAGSATWRCSSAASSSSTATR